MKPNPTTVLNNNRCDDICIFQDVMKDVFNYSSRSSSSSGCSVPTICIGRDEEDVDDNNYNDNNHKDDDDKKMMILSSLLSQVFFDLANSTWVGYRLTALMNSPKASSSSSSKTTTMVTKHASSSGGGGDSTPYESSSTLVIVKQVRTTTTSNNNNDQKEEEEEGFHSGKIVWEASFVLMQYLLQRRIPLGRTLEVGAGCGLLGLVMAASHLSTHVVMTDRKSNLDHLEANIANNEAQFPTIRQHCHAAVLDWEDEEEHRLDDSSNRHAAAHYLLHSHSMDTILGTDVVFTPTLVDPLLSTLQRMAHSKTIIYLCIPIRCVDAYQLLLTRASHFDLMVTDLSQEELASIPSCSWGLVMDCRLLKLTVITTSTTAATAATTSAQGKAGEFHN